MIRLMCVMALAAIASTSGVVYSSEGDDAKAVLEWAIKAHGGEANLTKYPAVSLKMIGNFHGLGEAIPFTAEIAVQGTAQRRFTMEFKAGDMNFRIYRVVNGDKGWNKLNNDAATALSAEELAEEKEKAFASDLEKLVPLKDKSFMLSVIGEDKVDDRPAIGIRATKKGHRDVSLYFDKKTHMLVKSETIVKDFMAGGMEYTQTTFFQEYKEVNGTKHATKFLIHKDGKRHVDAELSDFQFADKLDGSLFKQP
jgi:hypothetical protein